MRGRGTTWSEDDISDPAFRFEHAKDRVLNYSKNVVEETYLKHKKGNVSEMAAMLTQETWTEADYDKENCNDDTEESSDEEKSGSARQSHFCDYKPLLQELAAILDDTPISEVDHDVKMLLKHQILRAKGIAHARKAARKLNAAAKPRKRKSKKPGRFVSSSLPTRQPLSQRGSKGM